MKKRKGFFKSFIALLLVTIFSAISISETVLAAEASDLIDLKLSYDAKNIYAGDKIDLTTYGVYKENTIALKENVTYESSDNHVFTVEGSKLVAVNTGMASITAYYKDKKVSQLIIVQDFKAVENKLKSGDINVKLTWEREPNSIKLHWDKVESMNSYTISKRAVGEQQYKVIVDKAEGNEFVDNDVVKDREYEYQVALLDINGANYPMNTFKVPIYHEEIKQDNSKITATSENVAIDQGSSAKATDIKTDNNTSKPSTVQLTEEEYEKLMQQLKDQQAEQEGKTNFQIISEDLYGLEDLIVINSDNTLVINKELTLRYYYDNGLKIDESKLTIYSMNDKGLLTELEGVKLDSANKKITFFVKRAGIYMIKERVPQKEIITYEDQKTDGSAAPQTDKVASNQSGTKNVEEGNKSDAGQASASTKDSTVNNQQQMPNNGTSNGSNNSSTPEVIGDQSKTQSGGASSNKDTGQGNITQAPINNATDNASQQGQALTKVNITDEFIESTLDTHIKIDKEYLEKHSNNISFKYLIDEVSKVNPDNLGIYTLDNNKLLQPAGKNIKLDKITGLLNITLEKEGTYLIKDKTLIDLKAEEDKNLTSNEGKFNLAVAGIFSETNSIEKQKINEYINNISKENGIWIPEKDRQFVINIINYIANKKYYVNEKGFLKAVEQGAIDSAKSEIYSKLIDQLIGGSKRIILSKDNGFTYYDEKDGLIKKSQFNEVESYKLQLDENRLIILNSKIFEELENGKLSNDLALKLINQLDESSKESNSKIIEELDSKKVKPRIKVVTKVALYAAIGTPVSVQMLQGNAVYTGPDTVNYANIGSVDTNEWVTGMGVEKGWLYIEYSTSSGPKRGFVPLTSVKDKENVLQKTGTLTYTGYSDGLSSDATVYSGPGTNYVSIGSIYKGEGITVFNKTQNGFVYVEYSSSSGTKRGFVQAGLLMGRKRGTLASAVQNTNTYSGPGTEGTYVSIGSVNYNEFVILLELNDSWHYIEYNTKSGRKRGYTDKNNIGYIANSNDAGSIKTSQYTGVSSSAQTTYTGPYSTYASMGSIENQERVWVLVPNESGYAYIEYGTSSGLKRGYVPANTITQAPKITLPTISETGVSIAKGWKSGKGRDISAYKIGNGRRVIVSVFEIHGFEDAWAADGEELVKIATKLISNLASTSRTNGGLNGWTVYIIPYANPDGLIDGITNNGPGRTTIVEGIDLNRSFPTGFNVKTDSRNKTGSSYLLTSEARGIYDFITDLKDRKTYDELVVLDVHGWENTTIGDSEIGGYFDREFGFSHKGPLGGDGYFSSWAQSIGAKATLVELPWPNSSQDIANRGYAQKVINAVNNIISSNIGKLPSQMNIDYPTNNQVISGNLNVEGWALNQSGMNRVEVYIDGKLVGNATIGIARPDVKSAFPKYVDAGTSGYKYTISGYNFSVGNHTILAKAIGNDGTSTDMSRNVVKLSPRMNIDAPTEGQSISSNLYIYGWSLSEGGINQVKVYIDGNFVKNADIGLTRTDIKNAFPQYVNGEKSGFGFNLNINTVAAGNHSVRVESIGNDGSVISQSRSFIVSKLVPVIKIDSVPANSTFNDDFTVSGVALNPSGVKSVKILVDGALKGYALTGLSRGDAKGNYPDYPNADTSGFNYTVGVGDLASGSHTVTAVVTGNDGSTAQHAVGFAVSKANAGTVVSAFSITTSFLGGIADAIANNFQGLYQMISSPIQSAGALAFLIKAVLVESPERHQLEELVIEELEEISNQFTSGDANVKARMVGRAVGEIAIFFIGTKGIDLALPLLKNAAGATKIGKIVIENGEKAAVIIEGAARAVTKIQSAADDFLQYVSGNIIKLTDGFAFRPAYAGVQDIGDDAFSFVKFSEVNDSAKVTRLASKAGRYLDIEDVAPDIAYMVKSVKNPGKGSIWELCNQEGNLIKRIIKPSGFKSIEDMLSQVKAGIIDVNQWGYSSVEHFEEAIGNIKNYVNTADKPILMNSPHAGEIYNGIEFDPLGLAIFRQADILDEVKLLDSYTATELRGMSRDSHLSAATRLYRETMTRNAKQAGMDLDTYLAQVKKLAPDQIKAINDGSGTIPRYTWHHHAETGRMQLVNRDVHELVNHTGGNKFWGRGD